MILGKFILKSISIMMFIVIPMHYISLLNSGQQNVSKEVAFYNHTSIGISPTPSSIVISTPTVTPSIPTASPLSSLIAETTKTIGNTIGVVLGVLLIAFIILVVIFCYWIYFRIVNSRDNIRLNIISDPASNTNSEMLYCADNIQNIILRLNESLKFIKQKILINSEILKFIHLEKILPNTLSNPTTFNVKAEIGPIQINGLESWLQNIFKTKDFQFRFLLTNNSEEEKKANFFYSISQNSRVIFSKSENIKKENLEDKILEAACLVTYVISSPGFQNQKSFLWALPADVYLLKAIYKLAEYFQSSNKISLLDEVIQNCSYASKVNPNMELHSGLLVAISLQLSKKDPNKSVKQMENLLNKYKNQNKYSDLLNYYYGLSKFYTYKDAAYEEAILILQKIKPPKPLLFLFKLPKIKYQIFYLAQASIAIIKAHQISQVVPTSPLDKQLGNDILLLMEKIKNSTKNKYQNLNADEIEWRLSNAEIMMKIKLREDIEEAILLGENTLAKIPYALDVKANLGTLYLLKSIKDVASDKIHESSDFERAKNIFIDLLETGWDPGFINYRLGIIYRVMGDFKESKICHLTAKEETINVVSVEKIDEELAKIGKKDRTILIEQI